VIIMGCGSLLQPDVGKLFLGENKNMKGNIIG
jgi:hypothetical protein